MLKRCWSALTLTLLMVALLVPVVPARAASAGRLINVVAGKDGRFKVPGQKHAVITVKAGEVLHLHIVAHRGSEWAKDGAVHSFTVNALKDQGWDLRLKEGVNDFTLVAPGPGEYLVECTVKCGDGHDDMKMKMIVTP